MTTVLIEAEDRAVREAYVLEPKVLAAWCQEHLSQQLTAYATGLRDEKMVGKWASEKATPGRVRLWRLQQAYIAGQLLVEAFGDRTARSWFMGTNRLLDDESPAQVLRHSDGHSKVVPAARAFVEGSF